jgi:hypothetical protein
MIETTVKCPHCGTTTFEVTVSRGPPMGFYFGKNNAIVRRSAGWISLELDGEDCRVEIHRNTLWTNCPHIQDKQTDAWLRLHGIRPKTPLQMVCLGKDRFRVLLPPR